MDDRLITLISCTSAAEAFIIKTKLENNDIAAFVFDDQLASVHTYLSSTIDGVS